ncbi:MAG: TetR/AcrR family transcriptional regulator [Leptospiraceae bacterium]|nr:TetR/AcrR family transcriptional regulator [Leptospiraceae bacterium]MCP5493946.1 TetR/AcrR family transcriptional regulator [Leptospiraceae bacterium]
MSLREYKKDQTLDNILMAAEFLLKKEGFQNVSIDSIAKQALVSRKTIYNYIKTKEEILIQIANKRLSVWLTNTKVHPQWKNTPTEKFIYIYRNLAKEFKKEKRLWQEIVQADGINYLRHFSQRPIFRELLKCFTEILLEGQQQGIFSEKYSAEQIAWNLNTIQMNICKEWTVSWPNSKSLSTRLLDSLDLFFIGINKIG